MLKTAIQLDDALADALHEAVERTGRQQDELIIEALSRYLNELGVKQKFYSLGAGHNPTLDASQTSQLLREAWGES